MNFGVFRSSKKKNRKLFGKLCLFGGGTKVARQKIHIAGVIAFIIFLHKINQGLERTFTSLVSNQYLS
jgi:hypothetical protein